MSRFEIPNKELITVYMFGRKKQMAETPYPRGMFTFSPHDIIQSKQVILGSDSVLIAIWHPQDTILLPHDKLLKYQEKRHPEVPQTIVSKVNMKWLYKNLTNKSITV